MQTELYDITDINNAIIIQVLRNPARQHQFVPNGDREPLRLRYCRHGLHSSPKKLAVDIDLTDPLDGIVVA